MSTLKTNILDTPSGSGNITVNRPTILTAGDIVEADIADNAVTLAKMAGNTDGKIITFDASGDPVAVGPGTDGQVLTSTGAGSPPAFEDAGGKFVNQTVYYNSTRTSLSTSADSVIFTYTFSKTNNAATSYVVVYGIIPIWTGASDNAGIYHDDTTLNLKNTNDSSAFKGIVKAGQHGTYSGNFVINQIWRSSIASGTDLGSGSHTFGFGWKPHSGSAGQRPCDIVNYNSTDDNRAHQTASTFIVTEILI
jgi:hypothetical protein